MCILPAMFYKPPVSPYKYPHEIFEALQTLIRNGKLPDDLRSLDIWTDKHGIELYKPTTEPPPGKWLIICNHNYDKKELEWVILLGHRFKSFYHLHGPLLIRNNGDLAQVTDAERVKELLKDKTDLKYYIFNAEKSDVPTKR